jgi:hypothetical protein
MDMSISTCCYWGGPSVMDFLQLVWEMGRQEILIGCFLGLATLSVRWLHPDELVQIFR